MKLIEFDALTRAAQDVLLKHLCIAHGTQSCECYPTLCICEPCRGAQLAALKIRQTVGRVRLLMAAPDPRDRSSAIGEAEKAVLYTSFFMAEPNAVTKFRDALLLFQLRQIPPL